MMHDQQGNPMFPGEWEAKTRPAACEPCGTINCPEHGIPVALDPRPTLRVKRVHPGAQLPTYGTAGAACFDVRAVGLGMHTQMLLPGQARTFRTGLAFEIPEGWCMKVYSRSGHGFKHGVRLANGTGIIDCDYTGELLVRLVADPHAKGMGVREGDRIAQCMLERVEQWGMVEADELKATERGADGFGSTGR